MYLPEDIPVDLMPRFPLKPDLRPSGIPRRYRPSFSSLPFKQIHYHPPPSQNRLIFTHLEGSKPQKFELTISPETLGDFEPLVNGNRIPVAGAVLVFTLIVTFSFRRQLIFVRHVAMEMELTLLTQVSP